MPQTQFGKKVACFFQYGLSRQARLGWSEPARLSQLNSGPTLSPNGRRVYRRILVVMLAGSD
jgi:hypothetical protein